MKTKLILALSIVTGLILFSGCDSDKSKQVKTGFLSDYSKLQKESDMSLRYVNDEVLAKYSGFMVDPVKVYFHSDPENKLTEQQITDLTNYLHTKILEAVQNSGKKVAYQPAAGVARIRVALTDIKRSSELSMLPQASLMGAGIGGASMEAEVVDSVSREQIGAVLESAKGPNIPLANLGDWTAAKNVMDAWATRFQKTLESTCRK